MEQTLFRVLAKHDDGTPCSEVLVFPTCSFIFSLHEKNMVEGVRISGSHAHHEERMQRHEVRRWTDMLDSLDGHTAQVRYDVELD